MAVPVYQLTSIIMFIIFCEVALHVVAVSRCEHDTKVQ